MARMCIVVLLLAACGSESAPSEAGTADAGPDAAVEACDAPIVCPPASGERAVLCGRVFDSETTAPAQLSMRLELHDPAIFLNDPDGSQAIASASPDACGRFVVADVKVPGSARIAILVDDGAGSDVLVRTAAVEDLAEGARLPEVHAFATRRSSDAAWSAGAALGGDSFAARGAYLPIFVDGQRPAVAPFAGTPARGVVVSRDGLVAPGTDYYFDDAAPLVRASVGGDATGNSGAALVLGNGLAQFSGKSSDLPPGCLWPTVLAAATPGVVLVHEHVLVCP